MVQVFFSYYFIISEGRKTPNFRDSVSLENKRKGFDKLPKNIDVDFTKKIDYAAITWDLDNDNGPGNEFDFDMSLLFKGKGFDYQDQAHHYKNLKGLPEANKFFYDQRWRNIDTLIGITLTILYLTAVTGNSATLFLMRMMIVTIGSVWSFTNQKTFLKLVLIKAAWIITNKQML